MKSILDELIALHPPKGRDQIIEETHALVRMIQGGNTDSRLRDKLFYLHLGLVSKLSAKNFLKLAEDDLVTLCMQAILPAAERYDIPKGEGRFSWVSFYMQRAQWAINDYWLAHKDLVRIPAAKNSYIDEEGNKKYRSHAYADYDSLCLDTYEPDDEGVPDRWKASYLYEKAHDLDDEQALDLKIFKLQRYNRNHAKLAKAMGLSQQRVKDGARRSLEMLSAYFQAEGRDSWNGAS